MTKLYINTQGEKITTIKELFEFLLPAYKNNNADYVKICSYKDSECTNLQGDQRSRSYSELWLIAKTQLPSLTKKEFAHSILKVAKSSDHFSLIFCPDARKIVLYQGKWSYKNRSYYDGVFFDFNNKFAKGSATKDTIDGITIYDILVKDAEISEHVYIEIMNEIINRYKKSLIEN